MKINLFQKMLILFMFLYPLGAISDEFSRKNTILHFDQPQIPLSSLKFKYDHELKPSPNDFRIIEVSYLSNKMGERWAIVTFENTSSGRRSLKNESIVATFANGTQSNARNLNESLKGHERLSKSVYFGIHRFPIVSVNVE